MDKQMKDTVFSYQMDDPCGQTLANHDCDCDCDCDCDKDKDNDYHYNYYNDDGDNILTLKTS